MSIPGVVEQFYKRIWNTGDLDAVPSLLTENFVFRGSLGNELRGHEAFRQYVCSVRTSLVSYQCEILDCVTEGSQAFAKMRFSGVHVAPFRGYSPTGKRVYWLGAALFRFADDVIAELWVLGDLAGLEAMLERNALGTV